MILNQLRSQTKDAHLALEKLLIPKIKDTDNAGKYAALLSLFYGYFHPLEQRIKAHIQPEVLPDLEERRKSDLLLSDLRQAGNHTRPSLCTDLPAVDTQAAALGALYVMEGSTLGGKVITSMLVKNLGISHEKGISFFYGYGPVTEAMWETFRMALERYASENNQEEIVTAAENTFIKFRNWVLANDGKEL